jgi:tetratricopeptide (TPR) repeat protein
METRIATKLSPNAASLAADPGVKCATAKELENAGDYEGAREALTGIWNRIGERPRLEGLSEDVQAEVLLRVGALSGWLGSSEQIPGAQAFAKDLISESIRAFEPLRDQEKVAEAQTDLAICYWREGAMDEARVWFREALARATTPANTVRALVNSSIVELSSGRLRDALALLDRAAPLLDQIENVAARGRYHMERGIVLLELGGAENLDKALIENAAASVYFERANHNRYFARVENNTSLTLLELGRYEDALNHLERARHALGELGDVGTAAQVNETRARVFLAQGRYAEAEKVAYAAATTLQRGGEQSLLAEALRTQGIALARMARYESARKTLKRAADLAEAAGDLKSAGATYLTMLQELRHFLVASEIGDLYHEADLRMGDELDAENIALLRECARIVAVNTTGSPAAIPRMQGGSLEQEVLRYEGEWIRSALEGAQGSVTRAAKNLGLTHQGLCYIINTRHKSLLSTRAPVRVRRKSLMKKEVKRGRKPG